MPNENQYRDLCDFLVKFLPSLLNGKRVDLQKGDNFRLAMMQKRLEKRKDALDEARNHAFYLAYTLRDKNISKQRAWEIKIERLSSKMILELYAAIRDDIDHLRINYPLGACNMDPGSKAYIPKDRLSHESYERLTSMAKMKVAMGMYYLITGIWPDEIPDWQFNFDLPLDQLLDMCIKRHCADERKNQRIEFV